MRDKIISIEARVGLFELIDNRDFAKLTTLHKSNGREPSVSFKQEPTLALRRFSMREFELTRLAILSSTTGIGWLP